MVSCEPNSPGAEFRFVGVDCCFQRVVGPCSFVRSLLDEQFNVLPIELI